MWRPSGIIHYLSRAWWEGWRGTGEPRRPMNRSPSDTKSVTWWRDRRNQENGKFLGRVWEAQGFRKSLWMSLFCFNLMSATLYVFPKCNLFWPNGNFVISRGIMKKYLLQNGVATIRNKSRQWTEYLFKTRPKDIIRSYVIAAVKEGTHMHI